MFKHIELRQSMTILLIFFIVVADNGMKLVDQEESRSWINGNANDEDLTMQDYPIAGQTSPNKIMDENIGIGSKAKTLSVEEFIAIIQELFVKWGYDLNTVPKPFGNLDSSEDFHVEDKNLATILHAMNSPKELQIAFKNIRSKRARAVEKKPITLSNQEFEDNKRRQMAGLDEDDIIDESDAELVIIAELNRRIKHDNDLRLERIGTLNIPSTTVVDVPSTERLSLQTKLERIEEILNNEMLIAKNSKLNRRKTLRSIKKEMLKVNSEKEAYTALIDMNIIPY